MALPLDRALLLALGLVLVAPACDNLGGSSKKEHASKEDDDDDDKPSKKKKKKAANDDDEAAAADKTAKPAGTGAATGAPTPVTPPPAPTAAAASNDVTRPNIGTYEQPVTTPTQQSYSMGSIKTIADGCTNANAIMVTAPESVGADYEWKYSRQAMLANQQYKVVADAPSIRGEVGFEVRQMDASMSNAYVLVAHCADGLTCNHLAAMYKSIVKSSNPQVVCGDLGANAGRFVKKIHLLGGGPQANLPQASDTISKCARIAACTIADDTSTTEDVGISCQKAPTSYKLDCATRYPCAEVLSCMK